MTNHLATRRHDIDAVDLEAGLDKGR